MSHDNADTVTLLDSDIELLEKLPGLFNGHDALYTDALRQEIRRAEIVSREMLPPDVVAMNSTVLLLDADTLESSVYTVVYPWEANADENRVSVLAPVGTAILGRRKGHVVSWDVPLGKRNLKILSVQQPECVLSHA